MDDKEINQKILQWLSEPEELYFREQLEGTKDALAKQLETTKEDHRYIQGRLSFCKEMLAFKNVLEDYLNEDA